MSGVLKNYWYKKIALALVFLLLTEICLPAVSLALTSGPSQPEVQSFEPVNTTEMVDLFSGDFTYNIPLFELPGPNGGYPFNLHYNAGINMDQEASWVGLGWNLNPGGITRQMQGLPDEYDGKLVTSELDIKPSRTYGASFGGGIELIGKDTKDIIEADLKLGISISMNNYKGLGYSLDAGIDISKNFRNNMSAGVGLNLSMDSQNGVGVNLQPNMSLSQTETETTQRLYVGIGYSSAKGLSDYSFGGSASQSKTSLLAEKYRKHNSSIGGSSTYSIMSGGYLPPVTNPMENRYTTINFKAGFSDFGIFGNVYVTGYSSHQYLANITKDYTSYGYMHAQKDNGDAMLDFNREKDGMLHKNSPNLAAPVATADIFTMTSQGGSSMFRAFRNDVGAYHTAAVSSQNVGGSAGLEVGTHFGADITFGFGETKSGKWKDANDAAGKFGFNASALTAGQENYYFKTYGEATSFHKNTYDAIGGEDAVALQVSSPASDGYKNRTLQTKLVNKDGAAMPIPSQQVAFNTDQRAKRNVPVQYVDPNNPAKGMYSINADGSMYTYAQTQMIQKNVECIYSVKGDYNTCTDSHIPTVEADGDRPRYKVDDNNIDYYFSRKTLKDYAYSYNISEIRGADYVDANGDGKVNDGDKGYWVKFSYDSVSRTTSPYLWRSPYYGGNFIAGKLTTQRDNKASYSYGEKTVSYLKSVETNSHIANFHITPRKDGRGANKELNSLGDGSIYGANSYKLEYISLHPKNNPATTLLKVFFDYSYDLCKNTFNNDGSVDTHAALGGKTITNSKGKLTLKKMWIEYENSARGKMNPYKFDYHELSAEENPDYSPNRYDRWGYNRMNGISPCDNPYVPQFKSGDPAFRSKMDKTVSAWSLKALTLPTGSTITIDYEADDYAYVQNQRAGQMFRIDTTGNGEITHGNRKVVFMLEDSISTAGNPTDTFKTRYTEGISKMYYRIYGNLLASGDSRRDYVSGYVDITSSGLEPAVGGYHKKGYVMLGNPKVGSRTFPQYHPFSLAFWQALMTDYSEMAFTGSIKFSDNESKSEKRAKLKSLVSCFGQMVSMFTGFYAYANSKSWGEQIDPAKSYIRLHSPDKIKIGGGIRVKKITLTDQWASMQTAAGAANAAYGQVYDYTTDDGKGHVISSGVATYEPMMGGDENPLRGSKAFADEIPLKLNNNVFFETPVNESYYPGASVGYSKVTVKSLASYNNEKRDADVPQGIMTTGAVCHEFFTCKDFPVINTETPITNKSDKYCSFIPFIGMITDIRATATQGYAIQLNDMHGKPRKVSTYKQNVNGAILYKDPVSYIEYVYKSVKKQTGANASDSYYTLVNNVPVLFKNASGNLVKSNNYLVGEEIEFFTDMREDITNNTVGGVAVNLDLVSIPLPPLKFPLPAVWPSFNYARTCVRTAVTNKIVHKFGIIDSIITYNGGSTVITKNLVFDGLTGQAVLTSITNNFDNPVFTYNQPAHMVYQGLSPAYKTVGLTFTGTLSPGYTAGQNTRNKEKTISGLSGIDGTLLFQGDVLSMFNATTSAYIGTCLVTRSTSTTISVQTPNTVSGSIRFCVTYPGRRNQLTVPAGSVTTLGSKSTGLQYNAIDQLYTTEP
jgi:hypothetical protein